MKNNTWVVGKAEMQMNKRKQAVSVLLLGILLSGCTAQTSGKVPVISPFPNLTQTPIIMTVTETTSTVTGTSAILPTPKRLSQLPPLSLPEFNARYSTGDLALSRDGKIMVVVSHNKLYGDKAVWLWNVNDLQKSLAGYQILIEDLWSVALSLDGDKIAIGGTGKIIIFDWKTGNISDTIELPEAVQLAFGQNNTLVSSSFDNKVVVWDLSRDEIKYSVDASVGFDSAGFAISPDGKVLVTGEWNGINLWDLATGQRLGFREGPAGGIGIAPASVFNSQGDLLASTGCSEFIFEGCSSGKIIIWKSDSTIPSVVSAVHSSWIKTLAFSPNDEFIVSGSAEGVIKLLNLNDGNIVGIPSRELPAKLPPLLFSHVSDMEFLSDGRLLAVSTNDGIQLLDIASMSWMPNLRFILSLGYPYSITTAGDNLHLRTEPSKNGELIKKLRTGERLEIVDGPEIADDYVWWKVTIEDKTEGWVIEMPGWFEFAQ